MGGGAVDDACEGLAGVGVVELVVVGVEDVGGLVGILAPLPYTSMPGVKLQCWVSSTS